MPKSRSATVNAHTRTQKPTQLEKERASVCRNFALAPNVAATRESEAKRVLSRERTHFACIDLPAHTPTPLSAAENDLGRGGAWRLDCYGRRALLAPGGSPARRGTRSGGARRAGLVCGQCLDPLDVAPSPARARASARRPDGRADRPRLCGLRALNRGVEGCAGQALAQRGRESCCHGGRPLSLSLSSRRHSRLLGAETAGEHTQL